MRRLDTRQAYALLEEHGHGFRSRPRRPASRQPHLRPSNRKKQRAADRRGYAACDAATSGVIAEQCGSRPGATVEGDGGGASVRAASERKRRWRRQALHCAPSSLTAGARWSIARRAGRRRPRGEKPGSSLLDRCSERTSRGHRLRPSTARLLVDTDALMTKRRVRRRIAQTGLRARSGGHTQCGT